MTARPSRASLTPASTPGNRCPASSSSARSCRSVKLSLKSSWRFIACPPTNARTSSHTSPCDLPCAITLGAIHVSQVQESGGPLPRPREWVPSCAALDPDLDLIPPSSPFPWHRVQYLGDHPRFPGIRECVAPSAPPHEGY